MKKTQIENSRILIYQNQKKWFETYKDFILQGKILIIGHGLGYTAKIVQEYNPNIVSVDIGLEEEALLKEKVIVYDGVNLPFENDSFDTVIITYVLHHAEKMPELFDEIIRVSKSKIIILEETYKNLFQKIDMVFYCWFFNRKAGQKVYIHWNSYLTHKKIKQISVKNNLNLLLHKEEKMRSYKTELFVFSKKIKNTEI